MNPFDLPISSFLNGYAHRSLRFDEFIVFLSVNNLFKGGIVLALLWWLWFRSTNRKHQEILLATILATFPALTISRLISWVYYRPRPLNEAQFVFRVPYDMAAASWEGHNSFPSDHAVLFFGLAVGIFIVCKPAGWLALAYVAFAICLPRIFIGEHYASDILGGGAIGGFSTWFVSRDRIRVRLIGWFFRWRESKPGSFYAIFFLVTYQIAELFDPIRKIVITSKFIIQGRLP